MLAAGFPMAASAQEATSGPFGTDGQFYWVCEDELVTDAGAMSGGGIIDSSRSGVLWVRWNARYQIALDDYREKRPMRMFVNWHDGGQDMAFSDGSLMFWWQGPDRLPSELLLAFDGWIDRGGFAAPMSRSRETTALASLKLDRLLRWLGDRDAMQVAIYEADGSAFFGEGRLQANWLEAGERDFEALVDRLEAKGANFETECERREHDMTQILVSEAD